MKFLMMMFGCLSVFTGVAKATEPMNVLVLFADDWRYDTLGAAGNPVVKTPQLDGLAKDGIRFTHNCVTTSICGVSRATLYTGQWMSRHGCKGFSMFNTPWGETYPGLLREQGYHTGFVGKWHNSKLPLDRFDFTRQAPLKHWIVENGQKIHVTQKNEKDAMEFLATRPKDKPFCLTVAFFATHAEDGNPKQYLPQPESMKMYEDQEVPVPPNATEESWKRLPAFFTEQNEGRKRWHWRFDEPKKYQTMMKNYFRMATEVDTACGRIIEELRKQGVLEKTLVIFTTDNGYYHGEHGLADKWYPHEESIRVPLIIRDPRMPKETRATTKDDFTLNVDLAPTILAAAGVKAPKGMQGRDMAALYLGDVDPKWRTEFFYEHAVIKGIDVIPASEALVRKDWKYMNWPNHTVEQLFNLKADPREENDRIKDPEAAKVLAEMRQRFQELKAAAK
jgi:arylsulfatase